jgi:hypothetical protein
MFVELELDETKLRYTLRLFTVALLKWDELLISITYY